MTTQEGATDAPPAGKLPSAFFVADGDAFVPQPIARGPWGDGVATGVATIVDQHGPIGSGVATTLSNPGFNPPHT